MIKATGQLKIDIFKDGIRIGGFEDDNLVTLSGKQLMSYLMAGEPGYHKITKFGVGEGTTFPNTGDTGLTNAYIRNLVGYRFLAPTVVQWDVQLDVDEANGLNIKEFGLYSESEQLFARKLRQGDAIPKDASVSFSGAWTVWLIECKKTTFVSHAEIEFDITDPVIGSENTIHVQPTIQWDLVSDANAERELAAQADIVFDALSSFSTVAEFASTANIVSAISDPIFDFTNVERRFTSESVIRVDTNGPVIWTWGEFYSDTNVQFDFSSDIVLWGNFNSEADIQSDITSDMSRFSMTNCLIGDPDDNFDGLDGTPVDSDRWLDAGGGGPSLIRNGAYEALTGTSWNQINSKFRISGDYDVEVDFEMLGSSPYNFHFYWTIYQAGNIQQTFDFGKDTAPSYWQLSTNNLNITNDIVDHGNLGGDPPLVSVRATRVGTTVTCYALYQGSGGWLAINSRGGFPTGDITIIFRGYSLAGGIASGYWNNFRVNSADDVYCV